MLSIIIYAVLLIALIVLFFMGTRFNRNQTNKGKQTGWRQWLASTLQSSRLAMSQNGNPSNTGGSREALTRDNADVERALSVLSDLYEEFQESMDTAREDLAHAIETSHAVQTARLQRLELRVQVLEDLLKQTVATVSEGDGVGATAEGTPAKDVPAEGAPAVTVRSERAPAEAGKEDVKEDGKEDVKEFGKEDVKEDTDPGPQVNDVYREILTLLRRGQSSEEVARSLGVGLTEVEIVSRIFGSVV